MKIIKVRIKTWNDMAEEFGIDGDGDIVCEHFFTKQMEEEMPDDRIIDIKVDDGIYSWEYKEGDCFDISDDMIEESID